MKILKFCLMTFFPFLLVIFIDQLTKYWARDLVGEINWGIFKYQLVLNDGIMLGHFSELPIKAKHVTLTTLGSVVLILYIFCLFLVPIKSRATHLGLSFLVGGIMGNVIDRFNGFSVVDFLSLNLSNYNLPYANLADFFQWCGYVLLTIGLHRDSQYYWPKIDLRKIFIINPKFQLRFSFLIASMSFGACLILLIFSYSFFKDDQSQIMITYFVFLGGAISAILASLAFFTSIVITHRIAGPIFAVHRHIKNLLSSQETPFQLREYDEFKELQEDMNRLNEKINNMKREK